MEFKTWDGKDLKGRWDYSYKIDGVRVHYNHKTGETLSRTGKPLYNLSHALSIKERSCIAEVYLGDWESSVSACRTQNGKSIRSENVFELEPYLDNRLYRGYLINPTAEVIHKLLLGATFINYEGLVLRQCDKYIKVKPIKTYDVNITGWQKGKGNNADKME